MKVPDVNVIKKNVRRVLSDFRIIEKSDFPWINQRIKFVFVCFDLFA